MAEDPAKLDRPWRQIADEVSAESDSDKVAKLSQELIKINRHPTRQSRTKSRSTETRLRQGTKRTVGDGRSQAAEADHDSRRSSTALKVFPELLKMRL